MKRYVVGFAFSPDKKHVLLIQKKRPECQRGKLNGIGGAILPKEQQVDAMVREFSEEAAFKTTADQWKPLLMIIRPGDDPAEVWFFYAQIDIDNCRSVTDEVIITVPVALLHAFNLLPDAEWLIPMALDENIKTTFYLTRGEA